MLMKIHAFFRYLNETIYNDILLIFHQSKPCPDGQGKIELSKNLILVSVFLFKILFFFSYLRVKSKPTTFQGATFDQFAA